MEQSAGGKLLRVGEDTMATLSNGGLPWLMKLQRIQWLSKQDPKMVFNNLGHIIDEGLLRTCFLELDGTKAVGIDGVRKETYAKNLDENLKNLLIRIRRGTYEPQAAKIVEIPKDDGSKRPLAISCIEDKIMQSAVNRILQAIYEPLFLPCSFGFRPQKSCHDALTSLMELMDNTPKGAIADVDIRKYFNRVPHGPLKEFLSYKITDSRFMGLIHKLLIAPTLDETGNPQANSLGVPQGSILSPVLANIYLHYVIDLWVEDLKKFFKQPINVIRYADDMVFVMGNQNEAERFFKALPQRLAKYGLEMAAEKSSIVPCGTWVIGDLVKGRKPMPKFKFLGFQIVWMRRLRRNRKGEPQYRPRVKPRRDRMNSRLKDIKEFLRINRNTRNHMETLLKVKRVMSGWMRYFYVSDCSSSVWNFLQQTRRMIFRWFNRRGKHGCMKWGKLQKIFDSIRFEEYPPMISIHRNPLKAAKAG